ncbi:hypothetical protein [Streptomyces yanii]|uniref:Uncharacterized protein n=1 Tax=Streptomyces yanii TaxID=78510 RepID=A0ABV5R407_9ACTN
MTCLPELSETVEWVALRLSRLRSRHEAEADQRDARGPPERARRVRGTAAMSGPGTMVSGPRTPSAAVKRVSTLPAFSRPN